MRAIVVVIGLIVILAAARPAGAQALGTFAWQVEPYCNLVVFTVTPDGPAYRLTGYDDQCGGAKMPAAGVVTPNSDGTFTLAFYLITPDGQAGHTTATLSPGSYSGPWQDDAGLTGTARFNPGASSGGTARPVAEFQRRVWGACPGSEFVQHVREDGSVECAAAAGTGGGDITGVGAGTGLTGGGVSGDVTLGIAAGGVGSLEIANGAVGQLDINVAQVQRRITTRCAAGLFFNQVLENGGAGCSPGASGVASVALGVAALGNNMGMANTALGDSALAFNTTGSGNTALGHETLLRNTTAGDNTAVGYSALRVNASGLSNTALGAGALSGNTSGRGNTAVGASALRLNETGTDNVGVGQAALDRNTLGFENTAIGWFSAYANTTGDLNVAVGSNALRANTIGTQNIAIGYRAGENLTTGDHNIVIGHSGVPAEAQTIRIGGVPQTRTFIRGIRGVTTGNANAVAVLIDSAGQLGTISSSRRTKEDIHDMGEASAAIFRLRPVTFRYIQPYADASKPIDYGLIAEEVEEVFPDLVVRNEAGEVETVQYHKLVPMLLNELQRLRRDLDRAIHPGRGRLGTTEPNADGVP